MSSTPFKVKAVFEYKSDEPDDLNFPNGQIITVTEEEDDDWYSGEYISAQGEKMRGIFPRNFVEKYEPTIPSRPSRSTKRTATLDPEEATKPLETAPPPKPSEIAPSEAVREAQVDPQAVNTADETGLPSSPSSQHSVQISKAPPPSSPPNTAKPTPPKPAPPVAEKPSSNSFKDRIAAFNKPAAAPIAPFKPAGQSSAGFIKKPFVAPPPSKNAYVPLPREPPPQKVYRREEEMEASQELPLRSNVVETVPQIAADEQDGQPKPTSLKDRIALLQKQQLEQAARHAEAAQRKDKPKKPPKKRAESSEKLEQDDPATENNLDQVDTNETITRKVDFVDEDTESFHGLQRRSSAHAQIATPPPPSRELVSDTNDADDSGAADTEDAQETSTEEERPKIRQTTLPAEPIPPPRRQMSTSSAGKDERPESDEEEDNDDEEEEEEEEDPEIRRRRELRDRMAKMSGGMGMMGMFGPPGGLPAAGPPRKPRTERDRQTSGHTEPEQAPTAPPVPVMVLPGMSTMRPPPPPEPSQETESDDEATAQHTPEEASLKEPAADEHDIALPPPRTSTDKAAPPVPLERQPPPPPARDMRAPPPPPPAGDRPVPSVPAVTQPRAVPPLPLTDTRPPKSDDAFEDRATPSSPTLPNRPKNRVGPPLSTAPPVPEAQAAEQTGTPQSPTSPVAGTKPMSRAPPPLPPSSPTTASYQTRPLPPPPPSQPPPRRSTGDSYASPPTLQRQVANDSDEDITEYDGDYDTDIAPGAKHKDALKSHNRDSSLDEDLTADEPAPMSPPPRAVPPPIPTTTVPRDAPPPPPASAPKTRKSMDAPRAAPPPIPQPKEPSAYEDEYDPYRYTAPHHGLPTAPVKPSYAPPFQSPREELEPEDMYSTSLDTRNVPLPGDRNPGQPPPMPVPLPYAEPQRQSSDVQRSNTQSRRSMDQARGSSEQGFIASDMDLAQSSLWWTKEDTPPPVLQNRSDVLCEFETSTSTKRGGRSTVSRDVYVLYMDYSQSTINASYDPSEPSHVTLEQSHDRPPPPPRQDQLEHASSQFGSRIAESASAKMNTTVGDGSSHAFILALLVSFPDVLKPVGNRAYGALVYANLANASTQQFDEIRPGDIVTFRNAKFSGHKGGLHSKYTMDVGRPDHVGIVMEWDGTKKKIRAWEQGRDGDGSAGSGKKAAKVREESFRVGDLRSGEVRVWRVMGRKWVGWDK